MCGDQRSPGKAWYRISAIKPVTANQRLPQLMLSSSCTSHCCSWWSGKSNDREIRSWCCWHN